MANSWKEWFKSWSSQSGLTPASNLSVMVMKSGTAPTSAGLHALTVATIVGVASVVGDKVAEAQDVAAAAFAGVSAAAETLVSKPKATLDRVVEVSIAAARDVGERGQEAARVVAGNIQEAVNVLQDPHTQEKIRGAVVKAWEAVKKKGTDASMALSQMCSSIAKWFSDKKTEICRAISGFFTKLGEDIRRSGVYREAAQIGRNVKGRAGKAATKFQDTVSSAKDAVKSKLGRS